MKLFFLLAQASPASAPLGLDQWTNMGTTGVCIALLVWIITKAHPQMLEKNEAKHVEARQQSDAKHLEARQHFEMILNKIEDRRAEATREGHDAAKQLSISLREQNEAIHENTVALNELASEVRAAKRS